MKRAPTPLVSFLLAAHDAAATLGAAVGSVLRQTVSELELVVVDDGSTDATPELLERIVDPRLVVVRNGERRGLAASLNRGLDTARGRWVARLDADDVALPERVERQLARLAERPSALLGSAVLEFAEDLRVGSLHEAPVGAAAVRWRSLFGAPVFHPAVVVDRELLDRHGLRYDTTFGESEDYDLWTRVLAVGEGDNLREPLTLRRVHPGQATQRRGGLQRSLQRRVALREIAAVAPELDPRAAELAWRAGGGGDPVTDDAPAAADALLGLLDAFLERHEELPGADAARESAARSLARLATGGGAPGGAAIARRALALDPRLPLEASHSRLRRATTRARLRPRAERLLADLHARAPGEAAPPVRVVVVSPEPTPYRSPLFDLVSERPEVELTVVYAGDTVAGRTWEVEPRHPAVVLDGVRVPGVRRVLRHDYPVTPDVFRVLRDADPDVVVAHGWSTFPSQAAIAWARRRGIPYLLLVSSHDAVERPAWRRAVRRPVVPPLVRGAWGGLALGTLSRASLVANGLPPERVRLFANTVDVDAVGAAADALAPRRPELRTVLGLRDDDVAVLCVARLVPEKGLDTLVSAVAAADDERLALVVAGEGPQREALLRLAEELGVRLTLLGDLPWEGLLEAYVAADVFALLSTWEPWAVVVNEAAASGLPLVLSDRVGAAHDLLRDGENGVLVPAGDVGAAAAAIERLAADLGRRATQGARSREIVAGWGYEPSVESFVQAVCEAAGRWPGGNLASG